MISLLGLLVPPLIDLINGRVRSSTARFWVSFLVCTLLGVVTAYVKSEFKGFENLSSLVEFIALEVTSVFGLAQISYKGVYEDSDVQTKIRGIAS